MQSPLHDHWYAVCRSHELPRQRPLAVQLFDQPLVVFRDHAGQAAVLEDRCAHRHAPLSKGRVCGGRLQCPYHGWTYDASGRVVEVPALGPGVPAQPSLHGRALPVCEQDGLIWCWPGAVAAHGAPPRIATVGTPGWTHFIMKTRFQGNVQTCLENFLDCPHATHVHRGWFRSPTQKKVRATVTTLDDGAVAQYFDEPRERSIIWALFAPRAGGMQHTDRFIAPATSCVDYVFPSGLAYNITSTCSPLSNLDNGAVEVFTVMSFRFRGLGPLVRLVFEPISRWIIHQDVRMLNAVAANRARFPADGSATKSTVADLLGSSIWRWRKALACGAQPPAAGLVHEVNLYL